MGARKSKRHRKKQLLEPYKTEMKWLPFTTSQMKVNKARPREGVVQRKKNVVKEQRDRWPTGCHCNEEKVGPRKKKEVVRKCSLLLFKRDSLINYDVPVKMCSCVRSQHFSKRALPDDLNFFAMRLPKGEVIRFSPGGLFAPLFQYKTLQLVGLV